MGGNIQVPMLTRKYEEEMGILRLFIGVTVNLYSLFGGQFAKIYQKV